MFFSGVTADMTSEVIEDYNLFQGVRSLYTLWEWSEIFMRNGFRMAITDQKKLNDVWKIESEIEEDDWYWYPDKESMRYCFYSKPAGHAARLLTAPPPDKILKAPAAAQELTTQLVVSANGKHVSTNGQVSPDYHDYYNGERPYAECWKECFCESYTIRLIRAIWGKSPPYSILDCGSASGLTIEAFGKVGVEAWGVENSQYIHAQTPAHLRSATCWATCGPCPSLTIRSISSMILLCRICRSRISTRRFTNCCASAGSASFTPASSRKWAAR